ncbi:DUF4974 domain-containing protein [Sphingobacterium sp. SGG-5]|uniref:FecR family protein n=1 Tax=Sphingobacterium sp. SGG-5 TaxID=2710881 RepID=UPI0013EBED8A|nr:FecR family protein [Sphingobacterium sp. SGG-5]NGM61332.1 DUF4974 domain-containing protein [Sphingobacterium sp. SGG-5]
MANEKDPFKLAEKIFLYHTDELNQTEQDALEKEITADPKLKVLIEELNNPELVSQELQRLAEFDTKQAYAQALEHVYPPKRLSRVYYRWIAASIALVAMAAILYRFFLLPVDTAHEILITQQDTTEGVQLVLATGERIRTDTLSFLQANETEFTGDNGILSIQALQKTQSSAMHKIIVPYKKKYQVILSDGSKVFLNAGSTLSFPASFGVNDREVQLEGEAFFEVTPMPTKQFVVKVGQQQIRVYGTVFNVKAYRDEPIHYTTLIEGRISLKTQDSEKELFLQPGNQANYDQTTNRTVVSSVNPEIAANWKDGWLAFDNRPMDEILRQVGRWYNLEIALAEPSLHKVSASGKILLYSDVQDVLRKFEKLGDIQFESFGNQILAKQIKNTPQD